MTYARPSGQTAVSAIWREEARVAFERHKAA